jgi:hypothetical protein
MKTVLILYPIQPYADALMYPRIDIEKYAKFYQRLIRKRYPDFQLIWVLFSGEESIKPDLSELWSGITIGKKDLIVACGISFKTHCELKRYPDPQTVIDGCLKPIEKLIIAGFHFWDCVEKIAQYAHAKNIDVTVDDDLTEFFFYKIRNSKGRPEASRIPLSRKESIAEDRRKFLQSGGREQLNRVREARKNKPWLIPI